MHLTIPQMRAALLGAMLCGVSACTPDRASRAPQQPVGPFPAGAVRAICAPLQAGDIYLLVGAAPEDAEAVEMVHRGRAQAGQAREDVTLVTLQTDGSAAREQLALSPEVALPDGGARQSLLRGATLAGTLGRARSGGPATTLTIAGQTHACRAGAGLRLVAVGPQGTVLVHVEGLQTALGTVQPTAVVTRVLPRGGGESVCAGAVWEEGRSSVTVTQDCGERRILYAPAAAPASDSVWDGGVRTAQSTLTAAFIDWSTQPGAMAP